MSKILERTIEESVAITRGLTALEGKVRQAAKLVGRCLISGHKLLICGNGGSASDATHMATEFLCRFLRDRRPYPAISLTANGEYLTAVGNDYHFDEIFARQVWGLGRRGDLLIAFTSSGKSRNVLRAIQEAKRNGLKSICFLGRNGGFTKGVGTLDLIVPGSSTARIQEAHKLLFHVLCEMAESLLDPTPKTRKALPSAKRNRGGKGNVTAKSPRRNRSR
jgi:D-sedoheptulose 7-phosphate isomerase